MYLFCRNAPFKSIFARPHFYIVASDRKILVPVEGHTAESIFKSTLCESWFP